MNRNHGFIAQFSAPIGQEVGLFDWIAIDQSMIDKFADAIGYREFRGLRVDALAHLGFFDA